MAYRYAPLEHVLEVFGTKHAAAREATQSAWQAFDEAQQQLERVVQTGKQTANRAKLKRTVADFDRRSKEAYDWEERLYNWLRETAMWIHGKTHPPVPLDDLLEYATRVNSVGGLGAGPKHRNLEHVRVLISADYLAQAAVTFWKRLERQCPKLMPEIGLLPTDEVDADDGAQNGKPPRGRGRQKSTELAAVFKRIRELKAEHPHLGAKRLLALCQEDDAIRATGYKVTFSVVKRATKGASKDNRKRRSKS